MKKTLLLLAVFILSFTAADSATYYVSKSGNDGNTGTSAQPWLTIQHAADMLTAGDTVFIQNGVYNEQVTVMNSGNAVNGHIVFSGYQNDVAALDGTGVMTGNNGFIIQASYVKVLKLTVRNWASTGIWVQGPVGFIEISNCKIHNTAGCISFSNGVHDFELNQNEMYNFLSYGFDATSDVGQPDSYNGTINDCYSHDGDSTQNCDGFAFGHTWHRNIVFNRCVTDNVYDGFDITGHKITLNRCLASNCGNGSYKLWSDSIYLENCIGYGALITNVELDGDMVANPVYNPKKITLRNCTFYNAGSYNILIFNPSWGDSLEMYNCIIAGSDNIGLDFEENNFSTYRGDYNVFHNDNPARLFASPGEDIPVDSLLSGYWTTLTGQDANSLAVTNLATFFADSALPDLHLLAGALAIDNGTSVNAPNVDYDGCPRPYNVQYDIGAYEYPLCNVGIEEYEFLESDFHLRNFPNPFSQTTMIEFELTQSMNVTLRMYDIFGREISVLAQGKMNAGLHQINFDSENLPSGVYVLGLTTERFSQYNRMLIIK